MIKLKRPPFYQTIIKQFVKHLNSQHPIGATLNLEIMGDDRLVSADLDDKTGEVINEMTEVYGIYNPENGDIIIAGGMFYPKWSPMILYVIAHEFYHALQHISGKNMDDRQADVFAFKELDKFIQDQEG